MAALPCDNEGVVVPISGEASPSRGIAYPISPHLTLTLPFPSSSFSHEPASQPRDRRQVSSRTALMTAHGWVGGEGLRVNPPGCRSHLKPSVYSAGRVAKGVKGEMGEGYAGFRPGLRWDSWGWLEVGACGKKLQIGWFASTAAWRGREGGGGMGGRI